MKLSTPRYTFLVFFMLFFMLCDLIFNCVTLFPRSRDSLLVIFIFQDLFLILSITLMMMTLFSTYLFQAGLLEVLVSKFRACVCACAVYLCVSVCVHAWWALEKWSEPRAVSSPALAALWALQRCAVPCYYHVYKRAALRASDPRLYEDVDWMRR